MIDVTPVILCGGSGTRLWPLSRTGFPKQFLCLTGKESLFQQAALRLANLGNTDIQVAAPLIVTGEDHRFLASEQLREIGVELGCALLEPVGRNTAPALTLAALAALEGGTNPVLVVTPAAGKLRLIATAGIKRSRMFPDLPTVGETVPGHEASLWFGVLAPSGTPKDIIARLNAAIVTAGKTRKVIDQLAAVAMESVNNSPEEFTAFIKAEIAKWGKVVKASGTSID